MVQLEMHHVHKLEAGGGHFRKTFSRFHQSVDSIKKHGDYHSTCPVCGNALHLTIFPGVSLPQAIKVQFKHHKEMLHPVLYILFLAFPLLFPPFLTMLLTFLPQGGMCVYPLCGLYGLMGGILWWGFVKDVVKTMQLECYIHEPSPPNHFVYYKGKSISIVSLEELSLRIPYYE
jgi:hypothetical protein